MKNDAGGGVSECIILGQSTRINTGAFIVVRRLMMDPRDLVARRILFEEGYVTTLEFNTPPPLLTPPGCIIESLFFNPGAGSPEQL